MNREKLHQLRDRITSQVFGVWGDHALSDTGEVVPHLRAALPALGRVNGRIRQGMVGRAAGAAKPGNKDLLRDVTPPGDRGVPIKECLDQLVRRGVYEVRAAARLVARALGTAPEDPDDEDTWPGGIG